MSSQINFLPLRCPCSDMPSVVKIRVPTNCQSRLGLHIIINNQLWLTKILFILIPHSPHREIYKINARQSVNNMNTQDLKESLMSLSSRPSSISFSYSLPFNFKFLVLLVMSHVCSVNDTLLLMVTPRYLTNFTCC